MKVKKTTFMVDGVYEPCIEVTDGCTIVRISKCYHLIGNDTLFMREIIDGDFNNEEEWKGDFDSITEADAIRMAKEFSAYIR